MLTKTPHWRHLLIPGLFVLVCVVATIATWRSFGGTLPLQAREYRVVLTLQRADNLATGADVRVSGVSIGRVRAVTRSGAQARAVLDIKPRFAPLRAGTRALVRSKSLLGEPYVTLALGPARARPIPDGARLPARAARAGQQLADVLQTFDPATRRNFRRTFEGLAAATDGRAEDLSEILGRAAPATSSIAGLLQGVDAQRPDLQRLIADGGEVAARLGDQQGAMQAAIRGADAVFSATAGRDRALRDTVAALPGFLGHVGRAADAVTAASPDLRAATASLRPAASSLPAALDAVDDAAPEVRRLFTALPGLATAAKRGLPPLTALLRRAGAPLADTHATLRELIPIIELAAADRQEIASVLANVGGVLAGKQTLGDGRTINYGAGIPTIWNEAIAGWIKRLPTNRLNPYPKPGSATDIITGPLKAYDCRNTGNTAYLPPTGTGAPPCVTQGPWSFQGKTRYYPALQPAAP